MKDVVVGIIIKDGKFLVEKRQSDDSIDPSFIEIPGGHVDEGETLEQALAREMKEELNIDVKKAEMVFKDLYIASNGEKQLCHYFHIKDWSGEPSSKEAAEIFWESDIEKLTIDIDRRAMKTFFKLRKASINLSKTNLIDAAVEGE